MAILLYISDNILQRWKNNSCQLFNLRGIYDDISAWPSSFEFEVATEELGRHKWPGID
jgi:hypothetical protein